jgi:hypothetical protein
LVFFWDVVENLATSKQWSLSQPHLWFPSMMQLGRNGLIPTQKVDCVTLHNSLYGRFSLEIALNMAAHGARRLRRVVSRQVSFELPLLFAYFGTFLCGVCKSLNKQVERSSLS